MSQTYEDQVRQQIEQYRETEEMHDLPPAFHLWSSQYVHSGLTEIFGAHDMCDFYAKAFKAAMRPERPVPQFLSLGCGDGAVEIGIARVLRSRGLQHFRFICYDLSDILLDRFRAALPADMHDCFELIDGDLNAVRFASKFDAVMANHSLHHIVDLEGVYQTTFDCLTDEGVFVTSDMIGRNGHMRWPESRVFVEFVWPLLTQRQRRNVQLRREEKSFIDHDCSTEGFEGIRSQDVLPLILKQGFQPWKFFGFGGMVDVFVDRCFGPNFDVTRPDDVFLVNRIGLLNEILLNAGVIKPTMMLAYFTKAHLHDSQCFRGRSAQAAIRPPETDPAWLTWATADLALRAVDQDFVFRAAPPTPVPMPVPTPAPTPAPAPAPAAAAQGVPERAREPTPDHAPLVAALTRQIATLEAKLERQTEQLEAIHGSTSWNVTGPLRALSRLVRKG